MASPIGISAGDFVVVGKLAGSVIHELKKASQAFKNSEAAAKYQNLLIELEAFNRALSRLYTLEPTKHDLVHLDAVRAAASACKRPLENFMKKIRKYDEALSTENANNKRYTGFGRRLQFSPTLDEDVKELRATLTNHASTINLLLVWQILNSITNAEVDRADSAKAVDEIKAKLETLTEELRTARSNQNVLTAEGAQKTISRGQIVVSSETNPVATSAGSVSSTEDIMSSLLELDNAVQAPSDSANTGGARFSAAAILDYGTRMLSIVLSTGAIVATSALKARLDEVSQNSEQSYGRPNTKYQESSQPPPDWKWE